MTFGFMIKNCANNLFIFLCSLCTNRTVVQKRALKEHTKQKSKNKDDSDVQRKADSNEDGDSETDIGKTPPKITNIVCIFADGSAISSERDEKWIQNTECLMWAHVECLDPETDIVFVNNANKYQF